jgi:hypothetical protein
MSAVGAALSGGLPPLPPALRGSGSAPLLTLNELIDKERGGSIDDDAFKKELRKLARGTKASLAKAGKEEIQQYDPMKTVLLDLEKLRKTTRYGKITERTTLPVPRREGRTGQHRAQRDLRHQQVPQRSAGGPNLGIWDGRTLAEECLQQNLITGDSRRTC